MPKNGNGHFLTISVTQTIIGSGDNDFITGSNGADSIDGRAGSDLIVGRLGDDILNGGNGPLSDRFGFTIGDGHDTVTDFTPAAHDELLFSYGTWANAPSTPTNLADHWSMTTSEGHTLTATQSGADAVFTWDTGDTVVLKNVDVSQLSTSDLHFDSSATGWMF